jgi:hypothetical protein
VTETRFSCRTMARISSWRSSLNKPGRPASRDRPALLLARPASSGDLPVGKKVLSRSRRT